MINPLASLNIPISHPVHIFAVMSLVILVAPIILSKLRLPGTVGLILAGLILGPNGLNILAKDASVVLFGTVGILYIMFLSGLEVDFLDFRRSSKKSLVFGLLTFSIPQIAGTVLAFYLLDFELRPAILLGSMYASHTLLAYPIASRLGITRDESVLVTIGGTLVTNTISLSILAVITSSVHGTLDLMFWLKLLASFTLFSLLIFVLLPRFARWFFCNVESEGTSQFMFILALVFVSSAIAHMLGIEPVIGAFLAGLSISQMVPAGSTLQNRINFMGNSIFIPYFLIYVGMLVDLRVLFSGSGALFVAIHMTLVATATKWLAAFGAQKFFGYTSAQRGVIFGLSNAQAANTLAAIMVGYQLGLLNENVLNGTIIMILVTCIHSALAVEKSGIRLALSLSGARSTEAVELTEIQRILVPIANLKSMVPLLDFAFAIKDTKGSDPVYPLSVVTDDEDASVRVAEADSLLREVRRHASGGGSTVKLISRIDVSASGGILRVIREMNISCVVLGWGSEHTPGEYFFGGLQDHLLDQSKSMMLVSGISTPLNTVKRMTLVLPPHAEFEHGLRECLQALHTLRRNLKVPFVLQGLAETVVAVRQVQVVAGLPDEVTAIPFATWEAMSKVVMREMRPHDLTVFLSAREGCLAWNSDIEPFAKRLRRLSNDANLLLLYAPANQTMVGLDPRIC